MTLREAAVIAFVTFAAGVYAWMMRIDGQVTDRRDELRAVRRPPVRHRRRWWERRGRRRRGR